MADKIESHTSDLHVLGTRLSERILDAQRRFAALTSKCEFSVTDRLDGCVDPSRLGPHKQGVGLKKDGQTWKLYFVEHGKRKSDGGILATFLRPQGQAPLQVEETYSTWRELTQVSLVEKSKAVPLLSRLFTEMQAECDQRASTINSALSELDKLDILLPPAAQEGE